MPKIMFRPAPTPPPFVPPTPPVFEDDSVLFSTWPFQANVTVRGIFKCTALPKQNPIYCQLYYTDNPHIQDIELNCIFNEDETISFEMVPIMSSDKLASFSIDIYSDPESPDYVDLNILND